MPSARNARASPSHHASTAVESSGGSYIGRPAVRGRVAFIMRSRIMAARRNFEKRRANFMSNALPSTTSYVVVGAGIHGLSTAWHLAMELQARGSGSGADVVVLDKTGPGAGA